VGARRGGGRALCGRRCATTARRGVRHVDGQLETALLFNR
jgi:hypothetical protein